MKTKTWMVEQMWEIGDMRFPIRSVVEATTKKKATQGANEACKTAAEALGATQKGAKPKIDAIVLYPL